MVCKFSELYLKEGSSLITTKQRVNKQESRPEHELAFLFGKEVVEQSQKISTDQMYVEADLVAEGARQLLAHIGEPKVQRRIMRGWTMTLLWLFVNGLVKLYGSTKAKRY